MKRSRLQFEANGDVSSAASPQGPPGTRPVPTPETDYQQSPRHVPKISRRIRACTECKRHKVRCDLSAGESICQRCHRMGLECVVNKSLQTLLDDETEWKATIELAMADLLRKAQLPDLASYQTAGKSSETPSKKRDRQYSTVSSEDTPLPTGHDAGQEPPGTSAQRVANESGASDVAFRQASQYALDREENGTSSLVTAPMGSLYEVTQLSDIQTNSPGRHHAPDRALVSDFVSRGLVDIREAEELFSYFDHVLSRYLWDGILLDHKDLTSVRNSSSMLSAAILAVTALHMPQKERTFDTCYTEFARLASESMLDRHHTMDDLRALCIGAFWLADVSWKLSGYAVRIATERNLHQSYRKAIQGSPEHIEQARLWYLLYTLEHHFSIAYGRPPIIHEDQSITNHNTFTLNPNVQQGDLRLHSQVDLFIILTRIYHAFGPDVDLEVPDSEFSTIEKFDTDLDNWRSAWYPRLVGSRYVGAYPYRAVHLHYHFSRLQLNSVALRTYHSSISTRPMSSERKKRANLAIQSAIDTLLVVLDEPDIQRALVGVPLYLHSMITFAAVFLLKIAAKGCSINTPGGQHNSIASAGLQINVMYVRVLVGRIVEMMVSCSKRASEHHLSHHIARGLKKMLTGLEEWEKRSSGNQQSLGHGSSDNPSMFKPIIIPGAQSLGEGDTILNHPPPMLGVAPLSAERGNGFDAEAAQGKQQPGLSEGSADPMMADLWGFDEDYFPTGVFDFLQSQMPA
ncbi:Zn(II)2Cys6 transcription factor [Aspergillus heteromorphus CBS 117.55]|uniref:Zn(II)2Cys6 transcription factor n=1 Tax=Aspergillus heteromorphus CBS 117.55 TaxID=1448321 RepID=A0A317V3V8_9EURO|nr:Zn(II)2Cys6 transcription factor [Aspergillus heteromorphus CBS 117.55]PWY67527.1 Zn(II)2Cys6 transcription factor [Aspergillus heteromorphus CBS 117.55]